MNNIKLQLIEIWKKPRLKHRIFSILTILLLIFICWGIVYLEGGTTHSYVHLMYLPIIFASFFWGVPGGMVTAIVSGILVGPLMPLDVEKQLEQPISSIILRLLFFILCSLIVGYFSTLLKSYIIFAQKTYEQLSKTYANTLRNYAKMVSARDEQMAHHCERVAYNARLVGKAYGLNERQSEALYWAGLLHDVGKIGVKEKILLKPDKLTLDEYMEIKKHTILGFELINSLSKDMYSISEGIRSHHEKWNGEGYPDGLKGKDIPLFGRIISIVDVFEALTSTRPYKDSWTKEDAIQYLINEKGKAFDPELVDIFISLYEQGRIWIYDEPISLEEDIIPINFHLDYDTKQLIQI